MSNIVLDTQLDDRFLRKPRITLDTNYAPYVKGFNRGIITGAVIVFVLYTIFILIYSLLFK